MTEKSGEETDGDAAHKCHQTSDAFLRKQLNLHTMFKKSSKVVSSEDKKAGRCIRGEELLMTASTKKFVLMLEDCRDEATEPALGPVVVVADKFR